MKLFHCCLFHLLKLGNVYENWLLLCGIGKLMSELAPWRVLVSVDDCFRWIVGSAK
jgi:hypothetical protein